MTTALVIVGCVAFGVPLLAATVLLLAVVATETPTSVANKAADRAFRRSLAADNLRADIRDHALLLIACGAVCALIVDLMPMISRVMAGWFSAAVGTDNDAVIGAVFSDIATVSAIVLVVATVWTVLLGPPILAQVVALHRCRVPAKGFEEARSRYFATLGDVG